MRILLVEDEPDLGKAIQRSLSRERYLVDWVQDGNEAWSYLDSPQIEYAVAVFDWMLPGLSGLELCKRLRARNNPLPILMLTAKDRIEDRVTGLDAGADDYLVKPFGMEELKARVRALQRRSPQLQTRQLQAGNLVLDSSTSTLAILKSKKVEEPILLTAKEFQIMEFFMQHPEQIITRDRLLNQIWEVRTEPTSNVVAAQIRLLRRKLAEYGYDNLIETLHGLGYRLNVPYESK